MKIVWGNQARFSYAEELDFINRKWNLAEVIKFMDLVENTLQKLSSQTLEGKMSTKTGIRSFVISKQTTLFFDINSEKNRIELLLFWNNKRSPKYLQKLIDQLEK